MILLIGGCGYIGSSIFPALSAADDVRVIDTIRRGNPGNIPNYRLDYGDISKELVRHYDTIILLAAHSSVNATQSDPLGAFANNITSFHRLINLISDDQRFIYASSSSIYSGFGATSAVEDVDGCANLYDLSKYVDDALAGISGKRCYGLRFGTVNGPSPNIRKDLMLNKMVETAINDHRIYIQNLDIKRPILGINDLTRAVAAIVHGDGAPGIYNLASVNATVADLGAVVASTLDVPLIVGPDTHTYDFEIDSTKFMEAYDFHFEETAVSIVNDLIGSANGSYA